MNTKTSRFEKLTAPTGVINPKGFPATWLDHLVGYYNDHVTLANEMLERLDRIEPRESNPVYGELRSIAHELPASLSTIKNGRAFLSILGGANGASSAPQGAFAERLRRDFGSLDRFHAMLKANATGSRQWTTLAYAIEEDRLLILSADTPTGPAAWHLKPLMVLDVSERARNGEFLRDKNRYVETLLACVNWGVVETEFNRVQHSVGTKTGL
jgi:superoxide dismutase